MLANNNGLKLDFLSSCALAQQEIKFVSKSWQFITIKLFSYIDNRPYTFIDNSFDFGRMKRGKCVLANRAAPPFIELLEYKIE